MAVRLVPPVDQVVVITIGTTTFITPATIALNMSKITFMDSMVRAATTAALGVGQTADFSVPEGISLELLGLVVLVVVAAVEEAVAEVLVPVAPQKMFTSTTIIFWGLDIITTIQITMARMAVQVTQVVRAVPAALAAAGAVVAAVVSVVPRIMVQQAQVGSEVLLVPVDLQVAQEGWVLRLARVDRGAAGPAWVVPFSTMRAPLLCAIARSAETARRVGPATPQARRLAAPCSAATAHLPF